MLLVHVAIARAGRLKDGHAHPTDMRLTAPACHMVAAHRLFHWSFAFGAVLDVQFLL
jgi:hypothetical protein